jgi:hypothetical protein
MQPVEVLADSSMSILMDTCVVALLLEVFRLLHESEFKGSIVAPCLASIELFDSRKREVSGNRLFE